MLPLFEKSNHLSQLINIWMDEKPGRNLHLLAKGSGLSYSNLRTIEAGKSDVTVDTTLRLLSYIQPDQATTLAILNLYPDVVPMLGRLLQQQSPKAVYKLLSQKACRAAVEIYGRQSASRHALEAILGSGTEFVVQELIDAGMVLQKGENYYPVVAGFHLNSPDILIPLLRLFLDNVNREVPLNLVEARFSGLTAAAAAEIQSIMEDAGQRALQIQQKPENRGVLTVAWGLLMTRF